jgi:phosphoglycerate dehydrogenase-like enzyme
MRVAFLNQLEDRLKDFPQRYLAGHEVLTTAADGQLPAGVEDAEAVVWWGYPVDASLISRLPKLRFMQRIGLVRARGDATAALAKGIPVSVTPFGLSDRVALHGLALTLDAVRKVTQGHQAVLEGRNPDNLPEEETTTPATALNWARIPGIGTLNDRTVGILGYGEIGACYGRMLAPFNCRVLYHKRTRLTPAQERYLGVEYAPLDGLLASSDVVASFVPYTPESRRMLGAREFGLMKPTAYFVNAGRGNTVDELALIDALQQRRIAGAGLDVFAVEPLPMSSPLRSLDNVVLTPHSAGGIQGWMQTFERLSENLRRVAAGEPVMLPMRAGDPQPGTVE